MNSDELRSSLETALDTLRPYIVGHGGDLELVDVSGSLISIKLKGACVSCPISFMTVKYGIEKELRKIIPDAQVEVIEDI